jgi:hypothetical protein
MLFRNGLCSSVSRVGALERMVVMCAVSSLIRVGVLVCVVGWLEAVVYVVRRWRRSTDLFRSVMMSLLTVLGQSLLRCLCVGREYGAFVGNFCVARDKPSASMSCMASAAAMTCRRVVLSTFGRITPAVGSGV